jgi:hypothetical protein
MNPRQRQTSPERERAGDEPRARASVVTPGYEGTSLSSTNRRSRSGLVALPGVLNPGLIGVSSSLALRARWALPGVWRSGLLTLRVKRLVAACA